MARIQQSMDNINIRKQMCKSGKLIFYFSNRTSHIPVYRTEISRDYLCADYIKRTSHGCSVIYNPCLPDGMVLELEAKWIGLQGKLCTACSALHFEPVQHDIEWRITFHEKRYTDFTLMLLLFQ